MYLIALVCPPLAILLTGRIFQAMFAVVATLFLWFPGALWAILVVADHKANKRMDRLIRNQKAGAVTTNVQINNVVNIRQSAEPSGLVAEMLADRRASDAAELIRHNERIQSLVQADQRRFVRILAAPVLAAKHLPAVATRAYHELPEWMQPISWGLAAGTPCAIIAAVLMVRSK